jgi:hypothetical protein
MSIVNELLEHVIAEVLRLNFWRNFFSKGFVQGI